ncbi:hypothetical protein DEU53_101823 [Pantoea sp. AG1095]|nr:hypothetical protein DEU53_101823 [Pantoea sp. AG1095]
MQMIIIYMKVNVNLMRGLACAPYEKLCTTFNASCGLVNG